MDLHSDYPYWLIKNGRLHPYPQVNHDLECDVLVMGAGISGALTAARLVEAGLDVIIIDRRRVATGSTCASTGLLLYEIDEHLTKLRTKVGQDKADTAYKVSNAILDEMPQWIAKAGGANFCDYRTNKSLYFASTTTDAQALRDECMARINLGLPCAVVEPDQLKIRFNLNAPLALITDRAAQCDTYAFTHGLLRNAISLGARVFESCTVSNLTETDNSVKAQTEDGHTISATKLVIAAGYESQSYLKQNVADLLSTYVLISEPLNNLPSWLKETHLWESARPYIYIRSTLDNRIIVGGEDEPFTTAEERDAILPEKVEKLQNRFCEMFPTIPLKPAMGWAGTFAETRDSLPRIGLTSQWKNVYFAMGYGGNGITFSLIAADIITGEITGSPKDYAWAFAF